uniref:Bromo domain-containing protein n=1 Tax=Rhabditophanes sp. KR3021 TaxID=114890 RepID=A0AC35TJU7_9BILA
MTIISDDPPDPSAPFSTEPVIDGLAKLESDVLCYNHLVSRGMLDVAEGLKKEIMSRIMPTYINLSNQRISYTFDDFLRMYADGRTTILKLLCELKKVKSNPNIREHLELRVFNRAILPENESKNGIAREMDDFRRGKLISPRVLSRLKMCGVGTMTASAGVSNMTSALDAAYRDPRNYTKMNLLYKVYMHTKAIYSLKSDGLGRFLITGSDDTSIKVFDRANGLIRASLRGHHAPISELSLSFDNKVLGSVSTDGWILFWSLKNGFPIANFSTHTSEITGLEMLPFIDGNNRYAVTIGRDGNIVFYVYNCITLEFDINVISFSLKNGAKSSPNNGLAYSPGGQFVVCGSYRSIYLYKLEGNKEIKRIFGHQVSMDRVDSIDWAHLGVKFAVGTRDGLIRIYSNQGESFSNVCTRLPQLDKAIVGDQNKFVNKVVMLKFSINDAVLLVSGSDHIIRTFCAETASFLKCYNGHHNSIHIILPHPIHENVVVTSGHDGIINIWNFRTGKTYKRFDNYCNHDLNQSRVAILDIVYCKQTSDIYISDMSGHISCFSMLDPTSELSNTPKQQFFATEYMRSVMNESGYLEDETTRRRFCDLPPTSLLNADQIPYELEIQRKIPGFAWVHPNDEVDIGKSVWSELDLITQFEDNALQKMDDYQRKCQRCELSRFAISSSSHNNAPSPAVAVFPRHQPTIFQNDEWIQRTGLPIAVSLENVIIPESEDTSDESYHGSERDDNPVVIEMEMDSENDFNFVPQPAFRRIRTNSLRVRNRVNATRTTLRRRVPPPNLNESNVRRTRLRTRHNGNFEEVSPEALSLARRRRIPPPDLNRNNVVPANNGIRTRLRTRLNRNFEEVSPEALPLARRRRIPPPDLSGNNARRTRLRTRFNRNFEEVLPEALPLARRRRVPPPNLNGNNVVPANNGIRTRLRTRLNRNFEETSPEEALPFVRISSGVERVVISSENEGSEERRERVNRLAPMEELTESDPRTPTPISENGERYSHGELSMSDEPRDESRSEESPALNESLPTDVSKMHNVSRANLNEKYPAFSQVYKLRRFPYYPQIGDHLVYFKQGYETYQSAVRKQKLYNISKSKKRDMTIDEKLGAETFCVVTKIEYLSLPSSLIHITIKVSDEVKLCNGETFEIFFNDCKDVADFLILREYYDLAINQQFKKSNKIESILSDDNKIYIGTIDSIKPYERAWPKSAWNRINVRWDSDTSTTYGLSAWELDKVSKGRIDGEAATDEDFARLGTIKRRNQDWGQRGMDEVLERAKSGLECLMEYNEVELFIEPVDFNVVKDYYKVVPYPIDLTVIIRRIKNKFYRRLFALEQDIKQIAINCKLYNGEIQLTKTSQALVEALITYINSENIDIKVLFEECLRKDFADLRKYSETPDEEVLLCLINVGCRNNENQARNAYV